jgi:hypothetical protein
MQKTDSIDFAKLLGFDTVAPRVTDNFDLRDETVGDKLGAKVGAIEPNIFHDETIGAKLGAKVGVLEP